MENTNNEVQEVKSPEKKKSIVKDLKEILESTFITVFVIVLIFTYLLHPVNVVGSSMEPTLSENDRIFMSTLTMNLSYGDIVIVNNNKAYLLNEKNEVYAKDITNSQLNECIIKRVIACGGQTVDIDFETGKVTVDGKVLEEGYIKAPTKSNQGAFASYPLTVPEGYYFVLGDNRNNSSDSRNPDVGFIKADQVYGKALLRYSPSFDFID